MRKSKTITIRAEGRDKGKVFVLTEMPARQAEKWGIRMMEALAKSGADIPEELRSGGIAGLFMLGFRAILGAPFALTEPLLDEMFVSCVGIVPDPAKPQIVRGAAPGDAQSVGALVDDDTEEIATRLLLRSEVFELHTGFSAAAFLSRQWEVAKVAADSASDTPTSGQSAAA